jgi:TRAP-type mannitol/chloroaromatic compound transport system permease small subunit
VTVPAGWGSPGRVIRGKNRVFQRGSRNLRQFMKEVTLWGRLFEKVVVGLNVAATAWIFGMIMFVVLDVSGRVLFNYPLTGVPEIIKISNPMIAFLQITYVLYAGRHIRTDILVDRMSKRGGAWVDIVNALMGAFIFGLNFYSGWDLTVTAFDIWEYEGEGALRVPTAPIRLIILIGSVLMIIQFLRIISANLFFLFSPAKGK